MMPNSETSTIVLIATASRFSFLTVQGTSMNKPNVLALIDAEIERLQRARQILSSNNNAGSLAGRGVRRKRRHMSAEAKRRISLAQKKPWAARKRTTQENG